VLALPPMPTTISVTPGSRSSTVRSISPRPRELAVSGAFTPARELDDPAAVGHLDDSRSAIRRTHQLDSGPRLPLPSRWRRRPGEPKDTASIPSTSATSICPRRRQHRCGDGRAIADGKTGYCPGAGITPLREALAAADVGGRRGLALTPDNITIHPGGKPVITKFVQALIEFGDEVLYPNPGYPIYESQIEFIGGKPLAYRYLPTETGFEIDLDQIRSLITPATKAIVYNNLQNPISAESTQAEMEAIAQIAIEHDLWVLADEAYFEMRYSGHLVVDRLTAGHGRADRHPLHVLQEVRDDRMAAGCRDRAAELSSVFSKLNTNNESCTTHFVQWAGSRPSPATRPAPPRSGRRCAVAATRHTTCS
jgi:DNA-binding transcriptional MocR family regulator